MANRNKKILLIILSMTIIALALWFFTYRSQASVGTVEASFINVGEGDSILLRDGNGFDVLIDGGKPEAGPTVVAYLRAEKVDDIDVMVNTHPDSDHVGGLIDVLKMADIPVRSVLYNGYVGTTNTWYSFATAVHDEGLQMTPAQYPATYTWGEMTVYVMNPAAGLSDPEPNNASVVLKVVHGSVHFLLTGDIDATQEAVIMARGTPVAAEILKVAHHGSDYSSGADFLLAVAPQAAVISVGPNSYGHPGTNTLQSLSSIGAGPLRTDQWGTIVFLSNGSDYAMRWTVCLFCKIYLPLIIESENNEPPRTADLRIVKLYATTTPEDLVIQNVGTAAQDMTGWTLFSVVGSQTFHFPAGYVLDAGASVEVESYTGAVDIPPAVRFWSNAEIWANTGDKAELRNASDAVVSSWCYLHGCP